MPEELSSAGERAAPGTASGIESTGNPIVDGISRLLLFLERLLTPQPAVRAKSPDGMNDEELREAAFKLAIALVDGLGVIVRASFEGPGVSDPSWHRPWPTTVDTFIRSMFMTSLDAFGTAAVGLGMNASVASTGNIRAVAECHVLMRWVLDGESEDDQRGRVLAMTKTGIEQARGSLAHWERTATGSNDSAMIAYVKQALDATEVDLELLAQRSILKVPSRPDDLDLFDRYLPGGYLRFALLSNVGTHPGPSPFFFYGESDSGGIHWDYRGLHAERAYWITQACHLQLENCDLAAPVCGWVNYEHLLTRIADDLGPIAAEAEKRFTARRDPMRIWI